MSKKIIEKVNTEYNNYRIPGMVCTENGTLLAYYECREGETDWGKIDIKIIRSTDNGETWSTVQIVSNGENTLNNPVMIVNGEKIYFLYLENYKKLYVSESSNDGISFSAAKEITNVLDSGGIFYNCAAVGPGHGIVNKGIMLIPVWFAKNKEIEKAHSPSFVSVLYSKDDGETWALGDIIETVGIVNPNESTLGINKDGKVLISIRNENSIKRRVLAVSDTGYDNWSDTYFCDELNDPICQGSMDSHDGFLFHINCANETERKNLCIKISDDDFLTCKEILVDEEGGYSDIAVTEESIYVFYESNCLNDGLYFKKIKRDIC